MREELGWQPAEPPRRAVDLHVDGDLIAWFYEAAAPSTDAALLKKLAINAAPATEDAAGA